jgi:hypothetical protein
MWCRPAKKPAERAHAQDGRGQDQRQEHHARLVRGGVNAFIAASSPPPDTLSPGGLRCGVCVFVGAARVGICVRLGPVHEEADRVGLGQAARPGRPARTPRQLRRPGGDGPGVLGQVLEEGAHHAAAQTPTAAGQPAARDRGRARPPAGSGRCSSTPGASTP